MTLALPRLDRTTAEERGLTIADFLVPIRVGERLNARVRDVALVIAGALLIYLTARISFPVPGTPVPITGQTFGVLLVGGALGLRRGFLAVGLYLVLGLFLPFYAQGASGLDTFLSRDPDGSLVFGATAGYLLGFALAAVVTGRLAEIGWDRNIVG